MMNAAYDDFQRTIWSYYRAHGRHDLPWRQADGNGFFDPYNILVSEIMLQQTQVSRVVPKYQAFLASFPTVTSLADSPLGSVLVAWQGLGYNRRAKFLWQAARVVVQQSAGAFPHTLKGLDALPGVGVNTAGAVMAYAYNQPVTFVETNIRTVFIHHFFSNESDVADAAVRELVARTLPTGTLQPSIRTWYWALMDYGTYLKQTVGNVARASKSYVKQSAFHGSPRQLRGKALRMLAQGSLSTIEMHRVLDDVRSPMVLAHLEAEGMVYVLDGRYALP